jgi:hypothetical protein
MMPVSNSSDCIRLLMFNNYVYRALVQYMAFDYLWWVLMAFCLVRLLATDDPR